MKTFFNTKSMRERVLMTAFLLIALMVWGTSLAGRTRRLQQAWRATADSADTQLALFAKREQVAARMAKVKAQLDPSLALNATQAFAEIRNMAQGVTMEINTQNAEHTENFAMNHFTVTIRRASMEALVNFYSALSARAPYLGIEKCVLSSERASPGQLNAVFGIYSVEVLAPSSEP